MIFFIFFFSFLLWMFHWQYPLFDNCQFLQDSTLILPPYREFTTLTAAGTAVVQTKTLTTVTQKDYHLTHNHWPQPHPQRPRPRKRHHHVTKHFGETTSRRLWPNKKKKTKRPPNGRFVPLTHCIWPCRRTPRGPGTADLAHVRGSVQLMCVPARDESLYRFCFLITNSRF